MLCVEQYTPNSQRPQWRRRQQGLLSDEKMKYGIALDLLLVHKCNPCEPNILLHAVAQQGSRSMHVGFCWGLTEITTVENFSDIRLLVLYHLTANSIRCTIWFEHIIFILVVCTNYSSPVPRVQSIFTVAWNMLEEQNMPLHSWQDILKIQN